LCAELDQSGHFDAKDNARSPGTYYTRSRHNHQTASRRAGLAAVDSKTSNWPTSCTSPAPPTPPPPCDTKPNDSPTAADPQDPLINDPCQGSCRWSRSQSLYIGIDLYIDSDIQISSSTLAPHPSCYQLNVACNLRDQRLLINDFAGA
jgi:hypothetical protein